MKSQRDKAIVAQASRHRRTFLVVLLIAVAAFASLFWKPAQERLSEELIFRSETLDESVFGELVQNSDHPLSLMERGWSTARIPHRQAVMNLLKDWPQKTASTNESIEKILLAGACDVDASVRELAFAALSDAKHPQLHLLSLQQLRNADPQIRLLGLHYLRNERPERALPSVMALLDDPDLQVAALADAALRRWTGQDFGIRVVQAIAKKDDSDRDLGNSSELASFREGIRKWKDWWRAHQSDFPPGEILQPDKFAELPLPASDFKLKDLSGSPVYLSDFRGKVVLLNFWTTWCTACLTELSTLNELQQKHADDLVILGISLDGVPDEHGHIPGVSASQTQADDEAAAHRPTFEKIRKQVQGVIQKRGLAYRVLLDPQNRVGGRFNGGELPTNVLIDAGGRVRRRFIGARTLDVLNAMISEIAPASQQQDR